MSAPRLAICSPCYDGRAHLPYFRGVNDVRRTFEANGIETAWMETGSSANLPRLRNSLAALAMDWGADAILWIDSDIAASGDDALRLWNSWADIVAAAPQRRPATLGQEPSVAFKPMDGGRIELKNGLIEVGAVATAFCLTRREVFQRLKDTDAAKLLKNPDCPQSEWFRNFFWYELVPFEDGYLDDGEDYYFCRKAREVGFSCFIEPNVRPVHFEGRLRLDTNFWDLYGERFNGED